MKYMIKTFFIGPIVIILVLLLLDDELEPEAQTWMSQANKLLKAENDAYYLMQGLLAPANSNPIDFGRKKHQQLLFNVNIKRDQSDQTVALIPQQKLLAIPKHTELCTISKKKCFFKTVQSKAELISLTNKNRLLIERYDQFLNTNDFKDLTPPLVDGLIADWSDLVIANKLKQLSIIKSIQETETEGRSKLNLLIKLNRRKLASVNSLLGKMVFVSIINQNIELYNLLYINNYIKQPTLLAPLTSAERSLEHSVHYEFLMAANMFQDLLVEGHESEVNIKASTVYKKIIYKPNMSINNDFMIKKTWLNTSRLSAKEQLQSRNNIHQEMSYFSKFRNYTGYVMSEITLPLYMDYSLRLVNLDIKISLLNWRFAYPPETNINSNFIGKFHTSKLNPYNSKKLKVTENGKHVCVPIEENYLRKIGCLNI